MTPTRYVVCSALRSRINPERMIIGVRHYCPLMRQGIIASEGIEYWRSQCDQGFVDQFGVFLSREEAHVVATAAGQIRRRCGGDEERLYSENLY